MVDACFKSMMVSVAIGKLQLMRRMSPFKAEASRRVFEVGKNHNCFIAKFSKALLEDCVNFAFLLII